ncbi:MAG: hypothetical protein JSS32_04295 [Verrucomicrobia bacterium]|nr:hypothetical protein [Verrucomicrobiota bacterium]
MFASKVGASSAATVSFDILDRPHPNEQAAYIYTCDPVNSSKLAIHKIPTTLPDLMGKAYTVHRRELGPNNEVCPNPIFLDLDHLSTPFRQESQCALGTVTYRYPQCSPLFPQIWNLFFKPL